MPTELIKEVHGVKYMKLAAGSQPIIKAIFGECPKNASLASSSVLARLIAERNTKHQASDTTAVEELFGQQPKKRAKSKKRSASTFLVLDDGIQVLVPQHASEALHVRLEADDVTKLFDLIRNAEPDDKCLECAKRTYSKTGKFKRSPRSSNASDKSDNDADESVIAEGSELGADSANS